MAVNALAALIVECQRAYAQEHGVELNNSDIARRSGGVLTRKQVSKWLKEPIHAMPNPETLQGLADGLRVPLSVVTEKAMQSVGYEVPWATTSAPRSRAARPPAEASADRPSRKSSDRPSDVPRGGRPARRPG